jgi:hypothetical protein
MNFPVPQINLAAAWCGILLGIISGMALGLGFLREDFLGGYDSARRRLYRLAHISFFGLAFINFAFWLTVRLESLPVAGVAAASVAMIVGAVTMPATCLLTAHWRAGRHFFAVPVLSLFYGAAVTLFQLIKMP